MQELVTQNITNIIFATHETENNENQCLCPLGYYSTENLFECACAFTKFKGAPSHMFSLITKSF